MKRPAASEPSESQKRHATSIPGFLSDALKLAEQWQLRQHSNAAAAKDLPYPATALETVSMDSVADAWRSISKWPQYKRTPLMSLPWLSSACGVDQVFVKDESERCGLTSFKALGGGLVVDDVVQQAVAAGKAACDVKVATASAGNHGMGVAWGARRTGCQAVIYLGERVSESIADKMRGLGAEVCRVKGSYEDSLRAAKDDSEKNGWTLVQDVSWEGYQSIPARIHAGYAVVALEILEQLAEMSAGLPTHVIVNAGVGGFACALCGYLWHKLGANRPRFICVEPTAADCLQHCSRSGSLTLPANGESTVQTGLDCRAVSPLAWRVLERGVDNFLAVPDEAIGPSMKLLAQSEPPVVAGESGVAGFAVLLAAASNPDMKQILQLDDKSCVAVIMCEAPPSGESYEALVGMAPSAVVQASKA
eukprot:TRINITY_DN10905_c0_g1_i1.p1 TRINITY_DN10905_c0_g1~~TRINITY_DN10905_c0_g1_i1.p1  ORF type:complete len:421 (+),score=83.42 TRINITY_DN10905_c0_g1_i1:116-1378(+)